MSRISLNDVRSLSDIMTTDAYLFTVPMVPGFGLIGKALSIKCQRVTMPGVGNEAFTVNMYGHQVKHRGKRSSQQVFSASFIEDKTFSAYRAMTIWHEFVVNVQTGRSVGNKSTYATNAFLQILDNQGSVAYSRNIIGVFPQEVQDFDLDSGSGTAPLNFTVTFSYDSLG